MIRAVLFDLDGVLVEACEWHKISLNKALKKISGIEISEEDHIKNFNGLPTKKKLDMLVSSGRIMPEHYNLVWQEKQNNTKETVIELARPDPIKIELHKYLEAKNIKLVCVTNSIKESAELMLKQTGQLEYMNFVISNEDAPPKPDCGGYVRAMIRLGVFPEECIIVEDSPVGLAAAKAITGANVWQVHNSYDVTLNGFNKFLEGLKC